MNLGLFFEFPVKSGLSNTEIFEESFHQIQMAEHLGLDSVWLAEIHFSPERSLLSAPLVLASAIASRTKHIRVGTAVEVLPLANPIRLAEEVATLDHICQGRFEFGVGRSGAPKGYIGYNVPYAESRPRFYETLEILQKAWTQETFSHHGEFFQYSNVSVIPKPFQDPHPPIRLAADSASTFLIASTMALPIFIGLRGVPTLLADRVNSYKQSWLTSGNLGKPDISLRVPIYVSETDEEAQTDTRESALNFYRNLAPSLGAPLPGLSYEDNKERATRAQRLQTITFEDILETDTAFGSPDVVTKRLLELKAKFNLTEIIGEVNFGGLIRRRGIEKSIRLFAEKVAPNLR